MKRRYLLLFTVVLSFFAFQNVRAMSASMKVTNTTITSGQSVTATLTVSGFTTAQYSIKSSGATNGCDKSDILSSTNGENTTQSVSVTCKSTSVGIISIAFEVNALDKSYKSQSFSDRRVINVVAPREKDTNNYLKSLSVKDYKISPDFHQDTLEYSVTVPSTVNKVMIEGSAASGYANITGTGEVEVNEGANSFDIVVTSETGVERTYKLTVNVKDENPILVKLEDIEYTILKNAKNVTKPETYEATTVKINNFDIPAFKSDITGFLLVVLKDSSGNSFFAIYHEDDQSYELYNEQKSPEMTIYVMEPIEDLKGFIKTTVEINGVSYPAFQVKEDSKFAVVYGMNVETGKARYFSYHTVDNTFQEYFDEMVMQLEEEKKTYEYIILGCLGVSFLLFILCIIGFARKPRDKKKQAKTESIESEKIIETSISKENSEDASKKEKKPKKSKKSSEEKQSEANVEKPTKEEPDSLEVKDAIEKMNDVEEIIREYERTMALSKEELKKAKTSSTKKDDDEMYDLFQDDKKKRKRR